MLVRGQISTKYGHIRCNGFPLFLRAGQYSVHSDVWSLGLAIVEMAIGRYVHWAFALCALGF
jgi:hypothetical protein